MSPVVLRLAGSPLTDSSIAIGGVLDAPGKAYLSHRSAAAWWGLPGFTIDRPVHVVIPWQGTTIRTRLSTVHFHRGLPEDHLRTLNGVPVVSPALTIFLLAGSEHPARTERALDNAWSMGLVTHTQMHDLLGRLAARGRNGIRVIRKLLAERPADYVAPQSGAEGRVRRLGLDVGVELRRQVDAGDDDWIGRVDFIIEGTNKVIEVLSRRYHGSFLDRLSDEQRFIRLNEAGFLVLTVWDTEVWENPDRVRDRIAAFWRGDLTPEGQIRAKMTEMRLGLLVCDHVRPEFVGISGDYPDMFRRLFEGRDDVELVVYDAINGEIPAGPTECDAWITTGSRHSVNDDEPWIRRLEGFVRDVAREQVPFVGICFGHQLIAKALGGSVVESDRGWGVGIKEVEIREDLGLGTSYRLLNSHQDQVDRLPPGAEVLGWSEHCPISMIGVGDNIIGIQGHPEFETEYSRALMEARRGHLIPEDTAEAGLATLDAPPDSGRLAEWIVAFVRRPRLDDSG
jgi:GMP synthase (glutamine-hydrolysing)